MEATTGDGEGRTDRGREQTNRSSSVILSIAHFRLLTIQ